MATARPRRPGRRAAIGAVLAAVVLGIAGPGPLGPDAAQAAPLPSDWCAPTESRVDLPDVVAGAQIHVVYAHPADAPNRGASLATGIARDLAGVDTWWQAQDPTRTPRFDLADFPGCDSRFGTLDISTVALANPASAYGTADATLRDAVRAELDRTIGTHPGKSYLVYLDAPVSGDAGTVICGLAGGGLAFVFLRQPPGCSPGGFGTGDGFPARTAAHELIHLFSRGSLTGAPHVCPDDPGHVCESGSDDILQPGPTRAPLLSGAVLDPGRDDYYGHGVAGRVDARTSEFLARLDGPQYALTATVDTPRSGQVASTVPGIACPPSCTAQYDAGARVTLTTTPAPGYAFGGWDGGCAGPVTVCTVLVDRARSVTARFDRLATYEIRVQGAGAVTRRDDACSRRCTWEDVVRTRVVLVARPAPRQRFVGWAGACTGPERRCRLVVRPGTKVTATFEQR
jgi:hypothetical protein